MAYETKEHKGCKIEIDPNAETPALRIDGQQVAVSRHPATGRYSSPIVPYSECDSLDQLAKEVVDQLPRGSGGGSG